MKQLPLLVVVTLLLVGCSRDEAPAPEVRRAPPTAADTVYTNGGLCIGGTSIPLKSSGYKELSDRTLHAIEHILGVNVLVSLHAAVVDDLTVHNRLQHLGSVDIFRIDFEQVPVEYDHVRKFADFN